MPKLALRMSLMAADDLSDIWHFTANWKEGDVASDLL